MKKLFFVVLALTLASSVMFGQLKKGSMAFTTEVAPSGSGFIGGSGAIGGAYALSESMRLNVGLLFASQSSGGTSNTEFGVGAGVWMYQPAMENVTVFYGGGLEFLSTSVAGTSSSRFGVAAQLGAEYWFSPRFAWGGYVGFGFGSQSSGGNSTTMFGTQLFGTSLTWWFN